ncbi:hypothetical protein I6A84_13295 [Frankia sp. CNm7]|uniref:Uncharacterized protein n=2 Tax=Frankia nepalensis TaxID=1836974 RepID=A0A937RMX5_9ACTN|nr:hypothetical protein [Frankia nepalensis]MBL7496447.1 hypothetical protein [Frankia nepalensis]MBL7510816.1 hypothetical protein [Frankia nepalensis]MBL7519054.1 hypothetical protein [Frankia nepalensis]MBL7630234.1 hypothetical protein [Frankia nepalensis]
MSARQVRRFQLERDVDVSGVSGTGAVAFGAQAPDGTCVLWWSSGLESTTIYRDMETLLAIHGHGGMTRAIYIDPESRDGAPAPGGDGGGGHEANGQGAGGHGGNGRGANGHGGNGHGATSHGRGADAADAVEEEGELVQAGPDGAEAGDEPSWAVARAPRGVPRAAAHQQATRSVSRPARPPARSS